MDVELLAPAGSLEALKTALYFGADAVYCGGPMLQLRTQNAGFSFSELEQAVKLTHEKNKKIYVSVNSFAENGEITLLGDYANRLYSAGVDAVIVSDLGCIAEIREKCPRLPVHISTQANCQNYKAIEVYHKLGASRVVLGREMTIEAIEELKDKIPPSMELEVFVHGAMCMAYSGRCLLSSFLSNRSGNRGECSQPCRWNYYLMEEKRQNMFFPIAENDGATAILSSGDLKAIGLLKRLEKAGIKSFKIEGRMKSPYYVATVVNAYRHFMDGTAELSECEKELECASHRPYTTGFYFSQAKTEPNNDGIYRQSCSFSAIVLKELGNNRYLVEQRNRFAVGDVLEILSPAFLGLEFEVSSIIGENGAERDCAQLVQEKLDIFCPVTLHEGDILRKRL